MSGFTEAIVTILSLIIGVAFLSVLLSPRSNTTGVIQAAASGFGNDLGVATAPVTGNQYAINLAYPGSGAGGNPMFGSGFSAPVLY